MWYRTLIVITLFCLAACAGDGRGTDNGPVAAGERTEAVPLWRDERMELGRKTYRSACASCHDSGENGAPMTGNREQWSGRSDMWQAVLFEHANSGYLDMPGKGGRGDLSDEAVEAATEYMLGRTFPELPRD